jgi:hypothetical protein
MGSISVAAWIAPIAFVALLAAGVWSGELRPRGAAVFVAIALVAWVGLPRLEDGGWFVTPVLAILDVALVFAIFKGDVRIN